MGINTKTPAIKQTVGAQYVCFATAVNPLTYATDVEKTEVVKKVSVKDTSENKVVKASGKDYKSVVGPANTEISTEVVAFDPETLAKMRGETQDTGGLNSSGAPNSRPYFAYGKVVILDNGVKRWEWFPKCQLVENSDEIETAEDSFKEQNDTLTIRAMAFNDAGDTRNYVQTDMTNFPTGLTENEFFTKPIITPADLIAANPGA